MSTLSIPSDSNAYQLAPFNTILSGETAFYNQRGYDAITLNDLSQTKPLAASYVYNTESKVYRIAKKIFSILIFPIFYNLLHTIAGKTAILPASTPSIMGRKPNYANDLRLAILAQSLEKRLVNKRITIEVDGCMVDAMIVGKDSTLTNGRWMLASNGNAQFYEESLLREDFTEILSELKGNAIIFNYPGVGASSGSPNRYAMAKTYRAILNFLEDEKNGIGAKEIIGYGHSIGGGVQGDALRDHVLKKDVKYVFVKSRTFSNLSKEASSIIFRPIGFLVKLLGWNMDSVESSKKLQAPEIILQTAAVDTWKEIEDSSKIISDGVITKEASLAKALLDDPTCPKNNKLFFGIPEKHNDELRSVSFLAHKIDELLKK